MITDEDIDLILERGRKRTQEIEEKLKAADKGDLLDFRMDGGMSVQVFEGQDYSKNRPKEGFAAAPAQRTYPPQVQPRMMEINDEIPF